MPITNLTGTSWLINTTIPTTSVDFNSLNFTADYGTRNYTRFRITSSQLRYHYSSSYDTVYRSGAWTQTGYRTIHITGGTKATDQTAINWFLTNATQVTSDHHIYYSTDHGTEPQPKTVEDGYRLVSADLPTLTAEGYTFGGWYYDNYTYRNPASVGDEIVADTDLFAKWTEAQTSHLYVGNAKIGKAYLGGNVVKIYIGNTRII